MVCFLLWGTAPLTIANSKIDDAGLQQSPELLIADFNTPPPDAENIGLNNIGGQYSIWDRDPTDDTQTCTMAFVQDPIVDNGYALQLNYDVDSPNPAYNGFWMKLMQKDFTGYNTLNFYIRGDTEARFTSRLKIELKDNQKTASYVVGGITESWQKYSIPFGKYRLIKDWSAMNEFVIVFDDIVSKPKAGTIYVDHITLSMEPVSANGAKRRSVKKVAVTKEVKTSSSQ
ncbi:MAG: hypothetical protein KKH94_12490 [Candidatus Omnitrophica bacterium]|nr:hypothetical protein [Candidatus Omnitrophota bacterium]